MTRFSSSLMIIVSLAAMISAQTLREGGTNSPSARQLPVQQQTYDSPRHDNGRVDFCYGYEFKDGSGFNPANYLSCGQGAADAYCKGVGYESAASFEKDPQVKESTVMLLQPHTQNPGSSPHDAFKSITCQKQVPDLPTPTPTPVADTQTYENPKVNYVRLDWCAGYDQRMGPNNQAAYLDCGEPAATLFCKSVGYTKASAWVEANHIYEPTIYIRDPNAFNPNPFHDSFHSIECTK